MDRLYYQSITVPANTPIAVPLSVPWVMEEAHLEYIDITIPDGPSGLSGFRVLWAQQQIIPWGNHSYLTPNDEKIRVNMNVDITISGLVLQAYNLTIWDHTFYFRGTITDLKLPSQPALTATSGSVSIPGMQAGDFAGSGIDTLTAPLGEEDTLEGGIEDDGSADDAGVIDGASGTSEIASIPEGIGATSDEPAEIPIMRLPPSVTLVGSGPVTHPASPPIFRAPPKSKKVPPRRRKPVKH